MTITPGLRKTRGSGGKAIADTSEPAATRALMQALGLTPRAAAELLGVLERDVALLVAGHAHVAGPLGKFSEATQRWSGAWVEMADALISGAQGRRVVAPAGSYVGCEAKVGAAQVT